MLRDAHFMSIADRSILACWGVKGGLAGKPFEVVIDAGGPNEREVDALADAESGVALDPNSTDAVGRRGIAHRQLNHLDMAIADFDRVLHGVGDQVDADFRPGVHIDNTMELNNPDPGIDTATACETTAGVP